MDNFVADMIFVDAPAERVYRALVEPDELLEWLSVDEAVVGAWPEGEYRVRWSDGAELRGEVQALLPQTGVTLRDVYWTAEGESRGPSRLNFVLREEGGGVWLTVRHEDLDQGPMWETFAQHMRRCWVDATVALKRHVEQI